MANADFPLLQNGAANSPLELEEGDAYGRYTLGSPTEIAFILREIERTGSMVVIYFEQGQQFFLSAVLAVDPGSNQLLLDCGTNESTNLAAMGASQFVVTTALDRVKIQFDLEKLERINYKGSFAFRATLPTRLLRLQRREYYRLSTPPNSPINCIIPVAGREGKMQRIEVPIVDISGGGLGLLVPNSLLVLFAEGTQFINCLFDLPNEGGVTANLVVRNAQEVTTRTGGQMTRIGCEYLGIRGAQLTSIQRYITRIERERKARQSGLF